MDLLYVKKKKFLDLQRQESFLEPIWNLVSDKKKHVSPCMSFHFHDVSFLSLHHFPMFCVSRVNIHSMCQKLYYLLHHCVNCSFFCFFVRKNLSLAYFILNIFSYSNDGVLYCPIYHSFISRGKFDVNGLKYAYIWSK